MADLARSHSGDGDTACAHRIKSHACPTEVEFAEISDGVTRADDNTETASAEPNTRRRSNRWSPGRTGRKIRNGARFFGYRANCRCVFDPPGHGWRRSRRRLRFERQRWMLAALEDEHRAEQI